jgi:hypothetical protein
VPAPDLGQRSAAAGRPAALGPRRFEVLDNQIGDALVVFDD